MSGWAEMAMPVFNEHDCVCAHPADMHDDGFGCTGTGPDGSVCPCVAGWRWGADNGA